MARPRRRPALRGIVAAAVAFGTLVGPPLAHAPAAATIQARRVVGDLNGAVAFTFGPGNQIWYVEKATGEIRIHDLDTDSDRLFYDVPGVNAEGERGMLGIALHPNYPTQPYVYVFATRSVSGNLRNQILRLTDSDGKGTNRRRIFTSPVPAHAAC